MSWQKSRELEPTKHQAESEDSPAVSPQPITTFSPSKVVRIYSLLAELAAYDPVTSSRCAELPPVSDNFARATAERDVI